MKPVLDAGAALAQVCARIEQYNGNFGEDQAALKGLGAILMAGLAEQQGLPLPPSTDPRRAMKEEFESIFSDSSRTLARFGLDIRSTGERTPLRVVDRASQSLSLAVIDCEQLARGLREISPESLQRPEVRKAFESLLVQMHEQFMAAHEFFVQDGERQSLAEGLPPALAELERLGISTGNLALRLEQFREGTLLEHTLVEEEGLLIPPAQQGYGPASWHFDATGERYEKLWQGALITLARLGQNGHAANLHDAVQRNLLGCAAVAQEQVELALESVQTEGVKLPGSLTAKYVLDHGEAFLDVLERAKSVLSGRVQVDEAFPDPID